MSWSSAARRSQRSRFSANPNSAPTVRDAMEQRGGDVLITDGKKSILVKRIHRDGFDADSFILI